MAEQNKKEMQFLVDLQEEITQFFSDLTRNDSEKQQFLVGIQQKLNWFEKVRHTKQFLTYTTTTTTTTSTTSSPCPYTDANELCSPWQSAGYCADGHAYNGYMMSYCKASCLCGNAASTTEPSTIPITTSEPSTTPTELSTTATEPSTTTY